MGLGLQKSEKEFQSTLPQEERRGQPDHNLESYVISIHAPTRGATVAVFLFGQIGRISIHAPTRGATPISYKAVEDLEFQSTLPQEERRMISHWHV